MFKAIVVCNFAGCNQVFTDARILPCGKRTWAAHIDAMMVKSEDLNCDDTRKMIKCHFCQKIHAFPDEGNGEFPVDENISLLLSMKYCDEHEAAKKSLVDVTKLLENLTKLAHEDYVLYFFERVQADILVEKEINVKKLDAYYQKLVDDVHERKAKCLQNFKTNKMLEVGLDALKRTLIDYESKLKTDNLDFILKTLDGDQARWRDIQSKCDKLSEMAQSLGEGISERIIGDQMIQFKPSTSNTPIEAICGGLFVGNIDTKILRNYKKEDDLIKLCKLNGKQFKLLYRATRDGFGASDFHGKCDHTPNTLTLIKTSKGYIFGAYATAAADSANKYKGDPNAFIFSLVHIRSAPVLFPVKAGETHSVCCISSAGPAFGRGCDLYISNDSNKTVSSYAKLGTSFQFSEQTEDSDSESFLAGSYRFQTAEIEVFHLI